MIRKPFSRALKNAIPPTLLEFYYRCRGGYGFSGRYENWSEAMAKCSGYDAPGILEKTEAALMKVKEGTAVFERDSVLFEKPQYSWPVLASLLWVATVEKGTLNLLDFGGSLGSHYFQYRSFLAPLKKLCWSVVERPAVVECGRRRFENESLKFYSSLDECCRKEEPRIAFVSCAAQYLESPHDFLSDLCRRRFPFLLFDRTPFITEPTDRLMVQTVPPEIYDASYPAWFFSRQGFIRHFSEYDLVSEFDSFERVNVPSDYKGFLFRLRAAR